MAQKGEKGMTEDEVVGWHHQLNRHEFVQAPGVGDREAWRAVVRVAAESDTTEQLNWTEETAETSLIACTMCGHRKSSLNQEAGPH